MATVTQLGPKDHGRPMTYDEFTAGDFASGFGYELIEGKLYVSPAANPPQRWLNEWLAFALALYSRDHRDVVNFVCQNPRVFVPGRGRTTCPEPDVAAYRDYPVRLPKDQLRWEDVSPVLVVEVVSADDPDKDFVRNAELYFQVPSVREYWILDGRGSADRPALTYHRRYRGRWSVKALPGGATYTTRLLPGFELVLDSNT